MYSISAIFHFLIFNLNHIGKCKKYKDMKKSFLKTPKSFFLFPCRYLADKLNFSYFIQALYIYLLRNFTKWYFSLLPSKHLTSFIKLLFHTVLGFPSLNKHFQVVSEMAEINLRGVYTILSTSHSACQRDRTLNVCLFVKELEGNL